MRESAKPPVRGKTSPYGFFVKMCYEEHKKKYPNENVQVTEISKKCSEKWKVCALYLNNLAFVVLARTFFFFKKD